MNRTCSRRGRARSALALIALALATITFLSLDTAHGAPDAPPNGPRPSHPRVHALINARIMVSPESTIESGSIVLRDGVIVAAGESVDIPLDARVWDLDGHTVHAGFIDLCVPIAAPQEIEETSGAYWNDLIRPQLKADEFATLNDETRKELRELGFTTALIVPDHGAIRGSAALVAMGASEEDESKVVYYSERPQIMAFDRAGRGGGYPGSLMGSIALIRQALYDAAWHSKCESLYLQHGNGLEPFEHNDALAALSTVLAADNDPQPVMFLVNSELDLLRASKLRDEFGLTMLARGSGKEYRRLDAVLATGAPIVVPINFAEAPKVASLEDTEGVSLRELMEWEQDPTNARRLIDGGARVALTTDQLRERGKFMDHLRRAIKEGLDESQALAALTTTPAELIGVGDRHGTIEAGKIANLVVIEGQEGIFTEERTVREVWVNGERFEIEPGPVVDPQGEWSLVFDDAAGDAGATGADAVKLVIKGEPNQPKVTVKIGEAAAEAKSPQMRIERLSFVAPGRILGRAGWEQYAGVVEPDVIYGTTVTADGERRHWTAHRMADPPAADEMAPAAGEQGEEGGDPAPNAPAEAEAETETETEEVEAETETEGLVTPAPVEEGAPDPLQPRPTTDPEVIAGPEAPEGEEVAGDEESDAKGEDDKDEEEEFIPAPEEYPVPLGAYGLLDSIEKHEIVFVENATIWTCGPDGVIDNGDLIVQGGRIARVGRNLTAPVNALVIDAAGKHITPGLIDCHSHTGIDGGVNEGTQAITSEVRIADCIDPDDINWYRQLAGGLTACNQLHGSANPMGGQNSVVKLRWGGAPGDFPIEGAIPGIKFALGENVTQKNWGDANDRYPQSRMGVETIMRSAFEAAEDYRDDWDRYESMSRNERAKRYPPRRDLELDALVEILEGERLVHCHSYRQDEILMLLRLADDFGFTVGTLQHILEGYKVATEIAAHGAGASSFSDWWAYKFEVYDAIPYNGAIMHDVGVVVSFNSDSSELARRMNTEAAKAVRYGGVAPEEALKFVTLNPAKQLRIDDRVGSLEPGKDADFVIWSGDPLSTLSRCEQTWIEGAQMFSIERDAEMRAYARSERQRLIQKLLRKNLSDPEKDEKGRGGDKDDDASAKDPTILADTPPEIEEAYRQYLIDQYTSGMGRGECGCGAEEFVYDEMRRHRHDHH